MAAPVAEKLRTRQSIVRPPNLMTALSETRYRGAFAIPPSAIYGASPLQFNPRSARVADWLAQYRRNLDSAIGGISVTSFPLRLQPELDQAADGFGTIQFHVLTCDPFVN